MDVGIVDFLFGLYWLICCLLPWFNIPLIIMVVGCSNKPQLLNMVIYLTPIFIYFLYWKKRPVSFDLFEIIFKSVGFNQPKQSSWNPYYQVLNIHNFLALMWLNAPKPAAISFVLTSIIHVFASNTYTVNRE